MQYLQGDWSLIVSLMILVTKWYHLGVLVYTIAMSLDYVQNLKKYKFEVLLISKSMLK